MKLIEQLDDKVAIVALDADKVDDLVPLAEAMKAEIREAWPEVRPFNAEMFKAQMGAILHQPGTTALCLEEDGQLHGMLIWLIGLDCTTSSLHASELVWYVSKSHRTLGLRLFARFHDDAIAAGAETISCAHFSMINEKLGKYYEHKGFVHFQQTYMKHVVKGDQ